ncbi:nucleotidyl transferase AbiEii/AbiGii toxin family protein [Agreia sp. PsM10]|uniref:nucleotidyl transferase AbiEii/AbiGii toxin family protein n=1 Tax=Agreia sp. PsM10 TaxID=3030533 RepID=UPI00263B2280|nr:nucleotidyl transferase AbiEii/AbiGii toxin family protein [Agreia sp. PsM10]MDN4640474.1 nucleotidyl transferase AbiEii/AbiGii toxin family protein [Agreia sp. PsM10]
MNDLELQRTVTRVALEASASSGFALAGSGAIREHGVIDRLSDDVDLFTSNTNERSFDSAVDRVVVALHAHDFAVDVVRRTEQFARMHVRTAGGQQVDIDMGMDWRETEPVTLDVGPVLSIRDAIGNKVSALYSRAEARDFFDVDAIRAFGHYTDAELVDAARERDPGFDSAMFASQLERVQRLTVEDLREYGVDEAELAAITRRLMGWVDELRPDTGGPHE